MEIHPSVAEQSQSRRPYRALLVGATAVRWVGVVTRRCRHRGKGNRDRDRHSVRSTTATARTTTVGAVCAVVSVVFSGLALWCRHGICATGKQETNQANRRHKPVHEFPPFRWDRREERPLWLPRSICQAGTLTPPEALGKHFGHIEYSTECYWPRAYDTSPPLKAPLSSRIHPLDTRKNQVIK